MELKWIMQENGAWFAYGKRKSAPDDYRVMGKILPPDERYPDKEHPDSWFWFFVDENIAGGCYPEAIERVKLKMERMVVNQ